MRSQIQESLLQYGWDVLDADAILQIRHTQRQDQGHVWFDCGSLLAGQCQDLRKEAGSQHPITECLGIEYASCSYILFADKVPNLNPPSI